MVVLLPESVSAVRAALANRLQTSLNLAFGSALASIGLTIPVVVLVAVLLDLPLSLGLAPKDIILLVLSLFVCSIGLGNGRTNMMQGAAQVVIFAVFLFLSLVPPEQAEVAMRQPLHRIIQGMMFLAAIAGSTTAQAQSQALIDQVKAVIALSLIHISEPTRPY